MSPQRITSLNEEQARAVRHRGAPLRIVAGAGTGKTATLTARFIDLVEHGDARVDQILALTFTRKAANEMRERIVRALDQSYATLWVTTFHAFCQRALRLELASQGHPPRVIEGDERWLALDAALDGAELPSYRNRRADLLRQALLFIDRMKDECLSPEDAADIARKRNSQQLADLAEAYRRYQRQIRERGEFDFGELQTRFIEILESDREALDRWRDTFKHILIDEYQDVNQAQERIIKLLAGDGRNLTVVGDTDQAIYAFRGASHRFFDNLPQEFPGTETINLTRNYRSHQAILDAANALISHNPPATGPRPGLSAASGERGPTPSVYRAESEMDEAQTIAREIARLHWLEDVKFNDIAVLLRSVSAAGGTIVQAIREYGVPVVFAGRDYQTTRATADVAAGLRLIDGEEPDALCHILASWPVDPIRVIQARAETPGDPDFIDRWTREDVHAYRAIRFIRQQIAELRDLPLADQVYKTLEICRHLPPPEEPTYDFIAYMRAFRQILDRATRLAERGGDRAAFLATLEQAMREDVYEGDPGEDAVQLMTVHAAKGLEFDYVFVAGLADGRFPLTRRLDRGLDLQDPASWRLEDADLSDEEKRRAFLEEERRLGYVALTRARKGLYLSYAGNYEMSREARPTFIRDIQSVNRAALIELDRARQRESWSATEYARAQRETLMAALNAAEISGQALGDLLLSQWTLNQLPDAGLWTPPAMPRPYAGDEQLRLSYSSLSAWEECPRRYYYTQVLKLDDEKFVPQLKLGTAVHDAIEWLNNERRAGHMPTEAELIERFRERWDESGFEAPAQEVQNRQRGEALLRRYYRWEAAQQREIISTEFEFEIPFGHHVLTGRIDCVARNADGTVEIIDYKTGRKGNTPQQKAVPQLAIYRMAWEELHPGDEPRTSIYFLSNSKDRGLRHAPEFQFKTQSWALDLKPDQVDGVRERLAQCANGILSNQFVVTSDPRLCEKCAYASICEGADENG